ncbi:hypothetical protein ABIG06_000490 [Bradyrhizobium sp. USDA 326]|uniref:hypothetical protein n=1 Tax=unclassified Bradyrhizobium TaxID=2631580 RepID=UPI003513F64E
MLDELTFPWPSSFPVRAANEVERHAGRTPHRHVGHSRRARPIVVQPMLDVHAGVRTSEDDFALHGEMMRPAISQRNCG